MIGYVTVGVTDMEKAKAFYCELFADLGASLMMDMGRIAFIGTGTDAPMLGVCVPFDESDPQPGNGNMFAVAAASKEQAEELYNKAISLGATCDGPPGQRMPDMFYGAYVRDPDGNKMVFYVFG
jgi:predicted lactoylglutathione lyase